MTAVGAFPRKSSPRPCRPCPENHVYTQEGRNASGPTQYLSNGEINGMHKLKERQVLEIKKLLENSNDTEIAKLYNVSRRCICKIRNGKSWKHV